MSKQAQAPKIEFFRDRSLNRHAIRITGIPNLPLKQLARIHGVLTVVEDRDGCTAYLKPRCCREATMQAVEKALGGTR